MRNLFILLLTFISLIGYSQSSFTVRFKLNYTGDTLHYERVSHYFEPVSIVTTDVAKTIDSLYKVRLNILDSLEKVRMSKAFTLYYDPTYKYDYLEMETIFDPTDELLDTLDIIPRDSSILENVFAKQVLDSLNDLRKSLDKEEFLFEEGTDYDHSYDSKIYLLNSIKSPVMIFDSEKTPYCECYKEIVRGILSVRKYKRKILSDKTKSIYIKTFREV